MNVRRPVLTAVVAAVLAAGLAGCSSDDTSTAAAPAAAVTTIGATELVDVVDEEDIVVVDVRTPVEYAEGHVAGAVNIDVSDPSFSDEISALDPDATYVVYCRSGNRSADAAAQMVEAGFTDVYDVDAGLATLSSAGVPLTR
jgi:rhodanese-related sulfurtransferase